MERIEEAALQIGEERHSASAQMVPERKPARMDRVFDRALPGVMERQHVAEQIGSAGEKRVPQEERGDREEENPRGERGLEDGRNRAAQTIRAIHLWLRGPRSM